MRKLIIALFIIVVFVLGIVFFKKQESFDSSQTSNGIVFINSNNDLNTFKTNKNSVLLIDSNGNIKNLGFPLGLVIPWAPLSATATLPNGWSLCDGITTYTDLNGQTRTVPNLLNRFVLGAGTRAVGSTGGEETVTLQLNHIPKHIHTITTDQFRNNTAGGGCDAVASTVNNVTFQTTSIGGGLPHNNMPPYYVLKYLCYTGISQPQTQSPNSITILDQTGNAKKYTTPNNSLISTNSSGNINNISFVVGMIMIWDKATNIPTGWALCDGTTIGNYTVPNLKSRFILGDSTNKPYPSQPGGEEQVILSTDTIPNHFHNVTRADPGSKCYSGGGCGGGWETIDSRSYNTNVRTSSNIGDGTAHNNMPPYYVLVYICYVGNISNNYGINSFKNIIISNPNADINVYQTKNDSLLITDSNGSIKNLPFPKGLIIAWYNIGFTITDLPPGWSLCDGTIQNGYTTPNLRDKFIYGYDPNSRTIGTVGGEEQVTLQVTHLPSHNHSYRGWNGLGYDGYPSNCYGTYEGGGLYTRTVGGGQTDGGNVGNTSGNADPHNNMPPYFVLTYICYTGANL